ncbi:MAG: hypothetical protein LUF87_04550 [Alistipes sp.]|nr:hypothetical protein [Alistipes sp.]
MKNAVVIGASSGIRRELARLLALSGEYEKVALAARRRELLEPLAGKMPDIFAVYDFDASLLGLRKLLVTGRWTGDSPLLNLMPRSWYERI